MSTVLLIRAGRRHGLTRRQNVDHASFAAACLTYIDVLGVSIFKNPCYKLKAEIATGWTVRGKNPSGDEIFCTHPDRPGGGGQPSLLYRVSLPVVRRPRHGVHDPSLLPPKL
jgi:hypothetical protein